jgi:hypothetical protein
MTGAGPAGMTGAGPGGVTGPGRVTRPRVQLAPGGQDALASVLASNYG